MKPAICSSFLEAVMVVVIVCKRGLVGKAQARQSLAFNLNMSFGVYILLGKIPVPWLSFLLPWQHHFDWLWTPPNPSSFSLCIFSASYIWIFVQARVFSFAQRGRYTILLFVGIYAPSKLPFSRSSFASLITSEA